MNNGLSGCEQCGAKLQPGSRFCQGCGRPQKLDLSAARLEGGLTWETDISLLTNPLVLKQMVLVVFGAGLLMAFLLSFILAVTGEFRDIPMMLLISLLTATGLGLLLCLVALLFFRNRTRVRFTVNSKGVLWESVDKRARTGSRLAIVAGILGRSPQVAGAGALAVSREQEFVRWQDISRVEHNKRRHMITLRNSWRPVMLLVCLPEHYHEVTAYIDDKIVPVSPVSRSGSGPLVKGLLRTLLVALAAAPTFILSSYPFELDIFLPLLMFLFALATVWLIPLFGWVVIGCAAVLAVQITWLSFSQFRYLYDFELFAFFLSYGGLAFLVWFSWGYLRGKILSALMEG